MDSSNTVSSKVRLYYDIYTLIPIIARRGRQTKLIQYFVLIFKFCKDILQLVGTSGNEELKS